MKKKGSSNWVMLLVIGIPLVAGFAAGYFYRLYETPPNTVTCLSSYELYLASSSYDDLHWDNETCHYELLGAEHKLKNAFNESAYLQCKENREWLSGLLAECQFKEFNEGVLK